MVSGNGSTMEEPSDPPKYTTQEYLCSTICILKYLELIIQILIIVIYSMTAECDDLSLFLTCLIIPNLVCLIPCISPVLTGTICTRKGVNPATNKTWVIGDVVPSLIAVVILLMSGAKAVTQKSDCLENDASKVATGLTFANAIIFSYGGGATYLKHTNLRELYIIY